MDILIYVILVGTAVTYLTELVSLVELFNARIVNLILTLPLAYFGCWLFGITGFQFAVCGLSAAFISSVLTMIVNRPVVVNNYTRR